MSCGIYKIENKINHHIYIGQSSKIEERFSNHKWMAKNGKDDTKLYRAMRKYGIENFSFEVIEECNLNELNEKEIYWITKYDSCNNGYNISPGGDSGTPKAVVQYDLLGNKLATYTSLRAAASILNLSGANLTTCCQGKQKSYGGYLWTYEGDPIPAPYIDKRIAHTTSSNKRIVQQYSKQNELLNEFESAHEAARQINKPKCANHITECCQGKRKTCEGYIWKYKES